ncbi:MAG: hypothetical protein PHC34_01770 [Candidatus Gastranaerophilales bacterium]|nr:hypothetical protein [Candidatus Gastranaerophilales bacterium]
MKIAISAKILIIMTCLLFLSLNKEAFADDSKRLQLFKLRVSNELTDGTAKPSTFLKTWKYIKGKPTDSAVLGGMWSMHTSNHKDEMCGENNLIGLDYNGFTIGTFKNSYRNQSTFVGLGRTVYTLHVAKELNVDFKYRIGAIYGYKDKYPNVVGVSPLAYPLIGINYKKIGTDITIIPSDRPIFASNFRYNL